MIGTCFFPWPIFNQPAAASGKRPSCDVQISVMDFTKDIASRLVDMPIKAGEFHLHRASPLSPWFLNRFKQFEYRFLGYCKAFGLSSLQHITAPHLGTIARGEDAKGQASRCLWRSSTVNQLDVFAYHIGMRLDPWKDRDRGNNKNNKNNSNNNNNMTSGRCSWSVCGPIPVLSAVKFAGLRRQEFIHPRKQCCTSGPLGIDGIMVWSLGFTSNCKDLQFYYIHTPRCFLIFLSKQSS